MHIGTSLLLLTVFAQAAVGATDLTTSNENFRARFDVSRGTLSIDRADGTPLLHDSAAAADGLSTAHPSFVHQALAGKAKGPNSLRAVSRSRKMALEFVTEVELFEDRFEIQVTVKNLSRTKPLRLRTLDTALAIPEDGGTLYLPGTTKVLTNGFMYYDPGSLVDFEWIRSKNIESNWHLAFHRPGGDSLVAGFLQNEFAEGLVSVRHDHMISLPGLNGGLGFTARSRFNREMLVAPLAAVTAGKFVFQFGGDTFHALEKFAARTAELAGVKVKPPVNAWTHWAYTKQFSSEEDVLNNARAAAAHLRGNGLEYIQVDDGFPRAYGDWEGNHNFSHGMKWLADQIRGLGFKAGIWLAPFIIAEGTEVHREHPEWLVHRLDGTLHQVGGGPDHAAAFDSPLFAPKLYCLDITHPGAAAWMSALFKRFAEEYGYDFFKIDFFEWSLLRADRYYDPSYSKAAAYRRAMQIIRDAIGPDRHLLTCGPGPCAVGPVDSVRVGLDYAVLNEDQYFNHFNSAVNASAKRYYYNGRTWMNDADHLGMMYLSPTQGEAAATVIALSGGNTVISDRLTDLDPARMEILKKVLPAWPEAARPLDLFENDKPSLFALPVRTSFAEWTVVGVYNLVAGALRKQISARELGLVENADYLLYDFWAESFLGEVRGSFQLDVPAQAVKLLSLHRKTGRPQLLGTTRHFTQGAIELADFRWDEQRGTLSGRAKPSGGFTVMVYVPDGYAWAIEHAHLIHDFGTYTVKKMGPNVLAIQLRANTGEVAFESNFRANGCAAELEPAG